MSSSSKRQTTMAKMARERLVKEKRARKQEKRDERKRVAEEARANPLGTAPDDVEDTPGADVEAPPDQTPTR